MMLEEYISTYGLDTGDTYCDLQEVYYAIEFKNVTTENTVNAAIEDLNESPHDPEALAALQDAGADLWEVAMTRSLFNELLGPLVDDPEAAEAMAFISEMNDQLSLVYGEMLATTSSARDLSVSLTALQESDSTRAYYEGQADAYSTLDGYRNQRCE